MSYGKFLNELSILSKIRAKENLPKLSLDEEFIELRNIWIKDKRYNELATFILENWDSGNCDDFSDDFSYHLIENGELNIFKQLWKGILRYRLENLWSYKKYITENLPKITLKDIDNVNLKNFNQFSASETIERRIAWCRINSIEGINKFIIGLKKLNDLDEVERQEKLKIIITKLEKPKTQISTDKRKIDEKLFWNLIDESRINSQNQFEFLDNLKFKLESFNPKELRNFDKILKTKSSQLNTWELWALAYIVRNGCGDDEFDYFKVWVVSKGEKIYNSVKNIDVKEIENIFNEDPQLEELDYLAQKIYEDKTSELMKPVSVKYIKLNGKEWKENELNKTFPKLCEIFKYQ